MKNLLLFFILFSSSGFFAQQLAHMSQWSNHQFAINPAHAGIKTCLEAQSTFRGQWIKLEGAPLSGWITVSAPLNAKRKKFLSARHGMGGMVNVDQIGPFNKISAQLAYAGHFNFSIDNRLSLGLSAGAEQFSFDINQALPLDPDPVINGSASQILPTATFGAWWNGKDYYFGLAIYDLIPQKWNSIGLNAKSQMHAMFNAGYRKPINDKITFLPALYAGFTKGAPIDLQLQTLFDIDRKWTVGLGFRNTDALIAFFGANLGTRCRIMYSYDFILSKLRGGTFHSHELTFRFSPCKALSSDQQLCPLFN